MLCMFSDGSGNGRNLLALRRRGVVVLTLVDVYCFQFHTKCDAFQEWVAGEQPAAHRVPHQ